MTTTLNASTAGAGGLIATADNSGSLALQTAGVTALTISSSQVVSFTNGATVPSFTSTGDATINGLTVGKGANSVSRNKIGRAHV